MNDKEQLEQAVDDIQTAGKEKEERTRRAARDVNKRRKEDKELRNHRA